MNVGPLRLHRVSTQDTDWDPTTVVVSMNLRLEGCIVPSESEGARVSFSHVVVLDNFLDQATCQELREFLVRDPTTTVQGPTNGAHAGNVTELPSTMWEKRTADMAGAAATWGLRPHLLQALATGRPRAIIEVQSRLAKLYGGYDIVHLPSDVIQGGQCSSLDDDKPQIDCSAFLANAAAAGDSFQFHVDADPTSFPPSDWTAVFGDYFNGEPGKPLLVSLLIYLDDRWDRDWAAETLFLDSGTDTGVFVRPKAGRAVLMDQDVLHRVSPPSRGLSGGRLRLSLVLKLAFLATSGDVAPCLARPEWGRPVSFGSAAHLDDVTRQLAREMRGNHAP